MTYGSRYRDCPVCGERTDGRERRRYGPFYAHPRCHPACDLCGEEIAQPPIGKGSSVAAWCGKPVHLACKEHRS